MKKMNFGKIFCAVALIGLAVGVVSCGAGLDEELYDETVGKKTETVPPGNVSELEANVVNNAVSLKWVNPTDKDFYGLIISVSPAEGSLKNPMAFVNDDPEKIPTVFNVTDLPTNVSYTFTIKTFDYNMNYSSGTSVVAKLEGDDATASGNFFGTGNVFAYKSTKSAFDFGYCTEPTMKEFEITSTDVINVGATLITSSNKVGNGNFELVNCEPSGEVKAGEKIKIKVKYSPSGSPSWDEMDLLIGGADNSRLTLLGSSFPQPKNISSVVSEDKKYGLRLWLRADLIGSTDVTETGAAKRMPDYSGNNFHAIATDKKNMPSYVESDPKDLNGMPYLNFGTGDCRSQLVSTGNSIIDSSRGTTTFVVLKEMSDLKNGNTETIIGANSGMSFPTLVSISRTYDDYYTTATDQDLDTIEAQIAANQTPNHSYTPSTHICWGVKGSGLYGDYRFPFVNNNLNDENNTIIVNTRDTSYAICMRYEGEDLLKAEKNGYDYPSNIRMWMNGKERLLSYTYSSGTKSIGSSGSAAVYGCYGKPISDGKGHRYGTLTNAKVPSADDISSNNDWYKFWDESRLNKRRKHDFAYIYNPYVYEDRSGNKTINGNLTSSKASNDGVGNNSCFYFNNWISNEKRHNGIIYNMCLGVDSSSNKYSYGKIAEVIMFDYPLSDAEIAIVNNYIYYRYGIGSAQ